LYFPALHFEQSVTGGSDQNPPGFVCPELQVHCEMMMLPASEFALIGQVLQTVSEVAAIAVLYFPAWHIVHGAKPSLGFHVPAPHALHINGAPPSNEYPGRHLQSVRFSLRTEATSAAHTTAFQPQ
jgi:hypothetical protein